MNTPFDHDDVRFFYLWKSLGVAALIVFALVFIGGLGLYQLLAYLNNPN